MRVMISQPMGGLTLSEIEKTQMRAYHYLSGLGHEVTDTFFVGNSPPGIQNRGLYYLGMSIMAMSECEAVFFCRGWDKAKGCRIEYEAARVYGLKCIFE